MNSFYFNKKINWILIIIGFILIGIILFTILRIPPSNGYELSLYGAYPLYLWYSIILSILVGQIILVYSTYFQKTKMNDICGFFIILYSNAILLFMPLIRGYFINGREDILSHLGYMIDIQKSGNIYSDFYPMLHISGVILNLISGISLYKFTMFFPAIFSLFFVISSYLVGMQIFNKRSQLLMFFLCSTPLYGIVNYLLSPNHEADLFFPFILYLFLKRNLSTSNQQKYIILVLIISIFISFFHPMVSFLFIILILLFKLSLFYNEHFIKTKKGVKINDLLLIVCIIFLSWSGYLYLTVSQTKLFFNSLKSSLLGTSDANAFEFLRYSNSTHSVDLSIFSLIKITLYSYGPYIILGVLAWICVLYLLLLFLKKKNAHYVKNYIFFIYGFIFYFVLSIIIMRFLDTFGFIRIHIFSTFFSLILIPLTIDLFIKVNNFSIRTIYTRILPIFFIALILLSYFSVFGLYSSPYNLAVNQQVPVSNYYGMKNICDNRNDKIPYLESGVSIYRYHCLFYGIEDTSKQKISYYVDAPIDHFGYDKNLSIKDYYTSSHYLLSDETSTAYKEIFPEFKKKWKYTPEDFEKLNEDASVYKIYTNSHLNMFFIV